MQNDGQNCVSIVIPCYNEEANIDRTLDGLLELARNHNKYRFEIIAVHDGSKDGTWAVIQDFAQNHQEVLYGMREFGFLSARVITGSDAKA